MKTIFIASAVIFLLSSCTKDGNFLTGGSGGGLNWPWPTGIIDSNNKMKADIAVGATVNHFSVSGAFFTRYVWPTGDSSIVTIQASNDSSRIYIDLKNILTPGSYSFGHVSGQRKGADATYTISGKVYNSKYDVLSGSINIDTLTTKRIRGTFNVTCWNGTQAADITNGSFAGSVW